MDREQLIELLRRLPEQHLPEVEDLLQHLYEPHPPFKPTPLGGLWEGVDITEADIAQARKEMWGNFPREFPQS